MLKSSFIQASLIQNVVISMMSAKFAKPFFNLSTQIPLYLLLSYHACTF